MSATAKRSRRQRPDTGSPRRGAALLRPVASAADRLPEGVGRAVRSGPAKIGAAVAVAALGAGLVATSSKAKSSSSATTTKTAAKAAAGVALPSTTTTTVDSVPPGTPIDVGAKGLSTGSRGPAVLAVKQRLVQLRYDPGTVDDRYDYAAYMAVIAFEK